MRVLAASYNLNGLGDRGFWAALIERPFANSTRADGTYLCIVFPGDDCANALVRVDDVASGNLYVWPEGRHRGGAAWRGDHLLPEAAEALRARAPVPAAVSDADRAALPVARGPIVVREAAYHRNGVGGRGFQIAVVELDSVPFLAVVFNDHADPDNAVPADGAVALVRIADLLDGAAPAPWSVAEIVDELHAAVGGAVRAHFDRVLNRISATATA